MWPIDKIGVINQALALTGDSLVAVADDGSPSWNVASAAYEVAFEYALGMANWAQCTRWRELTPTGEVPVDNQFDTTFAKPQDCVHIILVRLNDAPCVYQIVGNKIELRRVGSGTVKIKYVSSDGAADKMLREFWTAIHRFVMAGIYRGLHEDAAQANLEERAAMGILTQAQTRSDQEKPKRAMFNSRVTASRRIRRPWPVTPAGWGGTGTPS
jgi:hypothetical protein